MQPIKSCLFVCASGVVDAKESSFLLEKVKLMRK